jgi:hypothetical protein
MDNPLLTGSIRVTPDAFNRQMLEAQRNQGDRYHSRPAHTYRHLASGADVTAYDLRSTAPDGLPARIRRTTTRRFMAFLEQPQLEIWDLHANAWAKVPHDGWLIQYGPDDWRWCCRAAFDVLYRPVSPATGPQEWHSQLKELGYAFLKTVGAPAGMVLVTRGEWGMALSDGLTTIGLVLPAEGPTAVPAFLEELASAWETMAVASRP